MKTDIHPKYGPSTIECACGNVQEIMSTSPQMRVNTCSSCHPFYTGNAKLVDTEGRVERFRKRYQNKD
jgi:large subunit ribosomal protein L31